MQAALAFTWKHLWRTLWFFVLRISHRSLDSVLGWSDVFHLLILPIFLNSYLIQITRCLQIFIRFYFGRFDCLEWIRYSRGSQDHRSFIPVPVLGLDPFPCSFGFNSHRLPSDQVMVVGLYLCPLLLLLGLLQLRFQRFENYLDLMGRLSWSTFSAKRASVPFLLRMIDALGHTIPQTYAHAICGTSWAWQEARVSARNNR